MTEGVCDTLTIRLIRSFEYRTHKNLILKNVPKSLSLMALKHIIADRITQDSSFKVYRNTPFDTFKIFTKPHGSKTSNLIINLDHDEWVMDDYLKTLGDYGIDTEYEISYYNGKAFEAYKKNPQIKW